jgi:hypothetical protein
LEWLGYAIGINQIRLPKNIFLRKSKIQKKKKGGGVKAWIDMAGKYRE